VSPRLLMPSSVGLPPLECCLGTKPQPSGHLTAVIEGLRISDRGHQRTGGERTDTRYLGEPSALGVLPMPRLNLSFEFMDLAVQLTQVGREPRDQRAHSVGQAVLGVESVERYD